MASIHKQPITAKLAGQSSLLYGSQTLPIYWRICEENSQLSPVEGDNDSEHWGNVPTEEDNKNEPQQEEKKKMAPQKWLSCVYLSLDKIEIRSIQTFDNNIIVHITYIG